MRFCFFVVIMFVGGLSIVSLAMAGEQNNSYENKLRVLEQEYHSCQNIPEGEYETQAEINNDLYRRADCYQSVGRRLIQTFYRKQADFVLKTFDQSIELIYAMHHDWQQKSDYDLALQRGSLYHTTAIANAVADIENLVKRYFDAVYVEISEAGSIKAWQKTVFDHDLFEENELKAEQEHG